MLLHPLGPTRTDTLFTYTTLCRSSGVLDLLIGGVADPHRSHAAITGEMLGDTLAQLGNTHHRIERLDLPARRAIDDIAQVSEIFLEHIERAEPVERLHRVIGVANTAIADRKSTRLKSSH